MWGICICVAMFCTVYVWVCLQAYIPTEMHECEWMRMCKFVCAYNVRLCALFSKSISTLTHTHTLSITNTFTHIYSHIHLQTHICTHTHIHIDLNSPRPPSPPHFIYTHTFLRPPTCTYSLMHAPVNSLRQCLFVSGMLVCLLCMYLCMLYLHVHCVCNVCNISTSSFSYISLFGFLISSVLRAACMLTSECSELSKAVRRAWWRELCEDQY